MRCARTTILQGSVSIAALVVSAFVGGASATSPGIAPRMTCSSLTGLTPPQTQILSATQKTGYCNVIGVINKRVSAQDPDHFTYGIGFALNLPNSWFGRFEMMGGGGTDGSLNADPQGSAGVELTSGWAVAADDGGHEDSPNNKSADIRTTTRTRVEHNTSASITKPASTTATMESKKLRQSRNRLLPSTMGARSTSLIIMGCSNGGRDGMVASQKFPELFDGVISQNPGFNLPQAAVAEAWNEQALAPLATHTDVNGQPYIPDTFPPQDLEVASAAILSACDALDGLVDGIIDDYHACTKEKVFPALDAYTCGKGQHGNTPHGGTCLTSAQVGALKKIYGGPKNSHGKRLYSNWFWDAGIWDPPTAGGAGFAAWNVAFFGPPDANTALNLTLGAGALPMVFVTPPVVTPVAGPTGQEAYMFKFDFDKDAPKIFAKTKDYPQSSMDFMTGVSLDLRPFKNNGGKLIISSSVNDGIFSGASIARWYRQMNKHMDGKAHTFARLFMVPNMAHCGGGPATNDFAVNELNAITAWVENRVAPDQIIAANHNTSSPFPSTAPFDPRVASNFPTGGTRPLCPYPQTTKYKGSGMTNNAASFVCVPHDERLDIEDDDDDAEHGQHAER